MSKKKSPRERLRRWVKEQGGATAAAPLIGCHKTYLSHLLAEGSERRPGLDVAFAIQRATGGAIAAQEWAAPVQATGTEG